MSSLWDSHRLGVEPMSAMTVIPSHDHDTDAGPVEYTVPPHHWDACRRTDRPFDTVARTYDVNWHGFPPINLIVSACYSLHVAVHDGMMNIISRASCTLCALDGTRTHNLLIRSQLLCPIELQRRTIL